MTTKSFIIRPITSDDRKWIIPLFIEEWGSVRMVSRGRLFNAAENPGFAAIKEGKPTGLITYEITNNQCEITTLNSLAEGKGIGTALIDVVKATAQKAGCNRLWLITTNDNTHALRFYQKYGFIIAAVYPDSIRQSRLLKPEIPLTGNDGIPLRDEFELEILL
jgi:GNAT superfamily N-acetyltransferase